jgi:hypothetical protein
MKTEDQNLTNAIGLVELHAPTRKKPLERVVASLWKMTQCREPTRQGFAPKDHKVGLQCRRMRKVVDSVYARCQWKLPSSGSKRNARYNPQLKQRKPQTMEEITIACQVLKYVSNITCMICTIVGLVISEGLVV